jgi:hypothetical protein
VVDLFAVSGGEQHDQSWHSLGVKPQSPNLPWQEQGAGTLAGADVPPFGKWKDRWGRTRDDFPAYLTGIRRATLAASGVWTWDSGLAEGDALRLHVVPLGGPAEVIMGRGRSPVWGKDEFLDYLLVRRHVHNGSASRFLTILDPCQKTPRVQAVRVLSEKPLVLEVTRAGGVDEITIQLPDGPSRTTALRPVGVRVRSADRDVQVGGTGYHVTRIADVDYARNEVVVPASEQLVPGRTVRIHNEHRSALFRIEQARQEGDRLCLTLDCTALFARGPAKEVAGDRVILKTRLLLAPASIDAKLGANPFAGAWLGARQVKAATRDGLVLLAEPTSPAPWSPPAVGSVVDIWQYGVGDWVELAQVKE